MYYVVTNINFKQVSIAESIIINHQTVTRFKVPAESQLPIMLDWMQDAGYDITSYDDCIKQYIRTSMFYNSQDMTFDFKQVYGDDIKQYNWEAAVANYFSTVDLADHEYEEYVWLDILIRFKQQQLATVDFNCIKYIDDRNQVDDVIKQEIFEKFLTDLEIEVVLL